jgi:L-rhamnose mutarotase
MGIDQKMRRQERIDSKERYIILHKHTFSGVLKHIHDSNIRNYSIFLQEVFHTG